MLIEARNDVFVTLRLYMPVGIGGLADAGVSVPSSAVERSKRVPGRGLGVLNRGALPLVRARSQGRSREDAGRGAHAALESGSCQEIRGDHLGCSLIRRHEH